MVYSTDVSTGEGEGGMSRLVTPLVSSKPEVARDAARRGEKWIYSLERSIGDRDLAFCMSPVQQNEHRVRVGGSQ